MIGMPYRNPRRLEQPRDEVVEKVWGWDQTGEELLRVELVIISRDPITRSSVSLVLDVSVAAERSLY